MQDSKKTKDQLIEKPAELRNRLDSLTGTAPDEQADSQHRSDRKEIKTSIQFIGDFGLVEARGLDISDSDIDFEIEEGIPFDMEFEIDEQLHQHRARMVWMQRLNNGRSRFGFQFTNAPTSSLLWLYNELDSGSQ